MPRKRKSRKHTGIQETEKQLSTRQAVALRAIQNSVNLKYNGHIDQTQVATLMGYSTGWSSTSVPDEVRKMIRLAATSLGLTLEERYPLKRTKDGMVPDYKKTPTLILHRPKPQTEQQQAS